MEPSAKIAGLFTPGKNPKISRSMMSEGSNFGENASPNLMKSAKGSKSVSRSVKKSSLQMTPGKSPNLFGSKTPKGLSFGENVNPNLVKSGKGSCKSVSRDSRLLVSPRNLMRERRFVVAKKRGSKVCEKCKEKGVKKCICVAYQSLRASQETFFDKKCEGVDAGIERADLDHNVKNAENMIFEDHSEKVQNGADEESEVSSAVFKRNRDKLLEEARESVPEPGSGRVMHLVKAFEKLLSMKKKSRSDGKDGDEGHEKDAEDGSVDSFSRSAASNKKVMNWALPGMQQLPKQCESGYSHESISSFCPSDLFMNSFTGVVIPGRPIKATPK